MRYIYRNLAILSFLLATGSFGIDVVTALRDMPAIPDEREANAPARPACDLQFFESARHRLRTEGQGTKPAEVLIGADQRHDYFFRFATNDVVCRVRGSSGPMVSPYRAERKEAPPQTRFAILACLGVILVCGSGLVALRSMRKKKPRPPDD